MNKLVFILILCCNMNWAQSHIEIHSDSLLKNSTLITAKVVLKNPLESSFGIENKPLFGVD
jgi:hypothetical protein